MQAEHSGHAAQALVSLGCLPTEENLLACMLHPQPAARPSLEQVLQHACWWNDKISLDFMAYVSDFLEELGQVHMLQVACQVVSSAADYA